MTVAKPDAAGFAPRLLEWFARHGRHDLPWQRERTPYRVWVSEIMLQQTQVATVIPYYLRFTAQFNDVTALAAAPLDAVLHHWSGLGYYARARNLHRAAGIVRDEWGGELPGTPGALTSLPGIGRSTAGAILALAFDERHAILDGNVKRVLARWGGVDGYPGNPGIAAELWALSEAVTPPADAADFTQAIMDLGATLCTRTKPRCADCPVAATCRARRTRRVAELPTARPKKARPRRRVWWLILRRGTAVLLERRPQSGIWGGLWGFPEFASRAGAEAALAAEFGATVGVSLAPIAHAFSHFDLTIEPLIGEATGTSSGVVEGRERTWYNSGAPLELGLAAPVAALLRELTIGGVPVS